MPPRFVILCLLACAMPSCHKSNRAALGQRKGTFHPGRLAQVDELLTLLEQPGEEFDRQFGARHQVLTSTITVEAREQKPEILEEQFVIDADGRGGFHVLHDSGPHEGLEATFIENTLYIRPRFGKFIRRRAERGEVERLRAVVEGVPAATLELLAPFLAIQEVIDGRLLDHPTRRLLVSKAKVSTPRGEKELRRKWRETLKVETLEGELEVDAASGLLLALRLNTRFQFDRSNGPSPVKVQSSLQLVTSSPDKVVPPNDFMAVPQRSRPMLDRNLLLDGLRPQ
jgi:hypothetical protein